MKALSDIQNPSYGLEIFFLVVEMSMQDIISFSATVIEFSDNRIYLQVLPLPRDEKKTT